MFRNRKTVFLKLYDGKLMVSKAKKTQSGYVGYWHGSPVILKSGGEVIGICVVSSWYPRSGFSEDEL